MYVCVCARNAFSKSRVNEIHFHITRDNYENKSYIPTIDINNIFM